MKIFHKKRKVTPEQVKEPPKEPLQKVPMNEDQVAEEKLGGELHFILLRVTSGFEYEIYNRLSKTKGVIEIHPLFGEYDLIVKGMYADTTESVENFFRSINGVTAVCVLKSKG